jgi:hypothetical protein
MLLTRGWCNGGGGNCSTLVACRCWRRLGELPSTFVFGRIDRRRYWFAVIRIEQGIVLGHRLFKPDQTIEIGIIVRTEIITALIIPYSSNAFLHPGAEEFTGNYRNFWRGRAKSLGPWVPNFFSSDVRQKSWWTVLGFFLKTKFPENIPFFPPKSWWPSSFLKSSSQNFEKNIPFYPPKSVGPF